LCRSHGPPMGARSDSGLPPATRTAPWPVPAEHQLCRGAGRDRGNPRCSEVAPVTAVLDDMDSRPGSTTSLLRTVIGLYLRDAGGWMPTTSLVELMQAM